MFCPRGTSLTTAYCRNPLPGNQVQESGRRVTPESLISRRGLAARRAPSPDRPRPRPRPVPGHEATGHIGDIRPPTRSRLFPRPATDNPESNKYLLTSHNELVDLLLA